MRGSGGLEPGFGVESESKPGSVTSAETTEMRLLRTQVTSMIALSTFEFFNGSRP